MIVFNKVNKNYGTNVGLKDATVHIEKGDFVFLVGPSGAGKTTFVRLILKEIEADSGTILVGGRDVTRMTHREIPELRQQIGMVFQDFRLLEKKTVYENVAFAMEVRHKKKKVIRKEVPFALDLVGIADKADRYPNELSAGEQQRVGIARAIVNNPKLLIADEPTTALDVTIQAQILELLQQLSQDMGMSILLITHNFGVVAETCQRTSVMYAGKVVETGETRELLRSARHPYSRALIRSIPGGGARGSRLETIPGSPPALFEPPASCMFAPRCPYADETCRTGYPAMADCGDGHLAACFKPLTEEVSAHV